MAIPEADSILAALTSDDTDIYKVTHLGRLCPWHHRLKTYKGWVLSGRPGRWRLDPPGESVPDPPSKP